MENQSTPDPKGNRPQKEDTKRHVYVESGVQIDVVQDLKNQHKTERTEDAAAHRKQLLWTKFTVVLVLIYTGLMASQVNLTRDFFHRDQRPYVFSTKVDPAEFAPPDSRLAAQVYYFNYGKSPAMHMRKGGWIFYGDDALKQADNWFKQLGNGLDDQSFVGETVLMQGEKPVNTIIVGHGPAVNTAIQYVVAMRIQYFDTFGNRYWSDICWWHMPDQVGSMRCIGHNEIH